MFLVSLQYLSILIGICKLNQRKWEFKSEFIYEKKGWNIILCVSNNGSGHKCINEDEREN